MYSTDGRLRLVIMSHDRERVYRAEARAETPKTDFSKSGTVAVDAFSGNFSRPDPEGNQRAFRDSRVASSEARIGSRAYTSLRIARAHLTPRHVFARWPTQKRRRPPPPRVRLRRQPRNWRNGDEPQSFRSTLCAPRAPRRSPAASPSAAPRAGRAPLSRKVSARRRQRDCGRSPSSTSRPRRCSAPSPRRPSQCRRISRSIPNLQRHPRRRASGPRRRRASPWCARSAARKRPSTSRRLRRL